MAQERATLLETQCRHKDRACQQEEEPSPHSASAAWGGTVGTHLTLAASVLLAVTSTRLH